MESRGPSVDPVTGQPKRQTDHARKQIREANTEKQLREQAENLELVFSDKGEKFKELVLGRLDVRIEQLIQNDAEASAYMHILRTLGHKFNAAKRASNELYRRHMGMSGA